MQTTLRLPDDLYRDVKRRAAKEGVTVTAFLEEALRMRLSLRASAEERGEYVVESHGSGGLQPGVDLDDMASLRDLMDGR